MPPLNPYMNITIPRKVSDHRPEQGTLTRPLFEAKNPLYKGDDGNEYGREDPPERAGGGVKPGAGRGPKILPEPPTQSEGPSASWPRR
jgi:hypothetical protein